MTQSSWLCGSIPLLLILFATGCQTNTQEGALFGGLFGTGAGTMIGQACGNPLAGAAIGAAAGAASGAAIGSQEDKIEAQNRALIAQQLGRQVRVGAVTNEDVIMMAKSGVNEDLIINHVRAHGMARPLQPNDLIYLQQQGISPRVVTAMESAPPPPAAPQTVIVQESAPPPLIVEGYWGPHYRRYPHYYHHW